jgi:Uma2 family endonuclease
MIPLVMSTGGRRATYEDVLAAPEGLTAELIDGVLYTQARPAARHAVTASRLLVDLGGPFDRGRGGPGGWLILYEPELHLHGDVLVPDIAAWRRERMPRTDAAAFEVPPDWVCEVLSPSTQGIDRVKKMAVYGREGVPWVWLVDPIEQLLEVYRYREDAWTVRSSFAGGGLVRAEPFDAIELELAAFWEA